MLATRNEEIKGKTAIVSGSGNVAQYTVEKLLDLGGKPITLSDSTGTIVDDEGIDRDKLAFVLDLKNVRRGRIKEYADKFKGTTYYEGKGVWEVAKEQGIKAEMAFPSATQNEIDADLAQALVTNGCICVSEGANMPSNLDAIKIYQDSGLLYGPAKAANAGGVATSGLEMAQNSMRLSWTREEVDARLQGIMKSIHKAALEAAAAYGKPGDYLTGANIAGYLKVANAMLAFGVV
jgi:glutamate dehydrogenase (NADP+)